MENINAIQRCHRLIICFAICILNWLTLYHTSDKLSTEHSANNLSLLMFANFKTFNQTVYIHDQEPFLEHDLVQYLDGITHDIIIKLKICCKFVDSYNIMDVWKFTFELILNFKIHFDEYFYCYRDAFNKKTLIFHYI